MLELAPLRIGSLAVPPPTSQASRPVGPAPDTFTHRAISGTALSELGSSLSVGPEPEDAARQPDRRCERRRVARIADGASVRAPAESVSQDAGPSEPTARRLDGHRRAPIVELGHPRASAPGRGRPGGSGGRSRGHAALRSPIRRGRWLLTGVVLLLLAIGRSSPRRGAQEAPRPLLLLISIDGLRPGLRHRRGQLSGEDPQSPPLPEGRRLRRRRAKASSRR